MTLKLYRQKRNFKKTSEPTGKLITSQSNNKLYVIQKHAASHLHYDFRLELNGVLLSWAIPKGPSLDPSIKRLAMHVEDHPIEYGSFEGIIPRGQYGGGTVMLWDKGKWLSEDKNPYEAYQKGNLTFILKSEKLNGKWKLIRINKDNKTWLLIKIKDQYSKSSKKFEITKEKPNSILTEYSIDEISENYKNTRGKRKVRKSQEQNNKNMNLIEKINLSHLPQHFFPKTIRPQLATLVDKPPIGKRWLHEIKFDGYRLLAFKHGKDVHLLTRNNKDWSGKFKSIIKEIKKIPIENFILDGEVVVLDEHQHSDFQLLQNAIKNNQSNFIYYVFDLIYYENYNLTSLPLLERKTILKKILTAQDNKVLHYSEHILGTGKDILKKSCELGLEGIVSKDATSVYSQKRDKTWLKSKCIKRQEFIIGGFNKSTRRNSFRSLMLGTFNKRGELNFHGNVGTGFTQASLQTINTLLSQHITSIMPFSKRPPASRNAVWLKPSLVAEVEFTEWTDSDTLRHPSFKGIRNDKPAKNIIREKEIPVENIDQEPENTAKKSQKTITTISHPHKILYPEDKITKSDIAEYYYSIQEWILPYIINRPLTFVRCPNTYQECFYQKHMNYALPSGLFNIVIKEIEGKEKYIYIKDNEGLVALSQMGVLEIHPWGSRIEDIEYPDIIVFDLDPSPKIPWKRVVAAAFDIKSLLHDLKLRSFVKTTGGKGLHVVIPINPEYDWNEVKNFSHELVNYLVNNNKEYTGKMTKAERKNKIYIDYLRNQRGATAIAPYSTRARKHAPVAAPLAWDELSHDIRDTTFTINSLLNRMNKIKKDPWKDFFKLKQSLNLDKVSHSR